MANFIISPSDGDTSEEEFSTFLPKTNKLQLQIEMKIWNHPTPSTLHLLPSVLYCLNISIFYVQFIKLLEIYSNNNHKNILNF